MALTLDFKDGIDLPFWRQVSPRTNPNTPNIPWQSGEIMGWDTRSRKYAQPKLYLYAGTSMLMSYSPITDGWAMDSNLSMSGTFGTGCECVFVPSQGFHACTVGVGSTTTKVVLGATVLQNSASVNENQFADRGDGLGFLVRIVNKVSGKIEERRIIGNTSGTTPTLYLDQALTNAPNSGDVIEFLAGRVYILNTGTLTANMFRYFDVLTGVINTTTLATTNLLATIGTTNNTLLPLDEAHVPYNRYPGEGFVVGASTYDVGTITPTDYTKKCLVATATAVGTITGQATSGDASVLANEYRNFQIRIVEDTVTPAAVGQRRRIASHLAGPSAVYTLASNWTTTPSANCKFVIENDNDKMILFAGGATAIYNYNHTANTWDTSTWAARGTAQTVGFNYQAYGLDISADTTGKLVRNSHIMSPRGSSTLTLDILDIAGGATGTWATKTIPGNMQKFLSNSITESPSWVYVSNANQGRYVYVLVPSGSSPYGSVYVVRFDLFSKNLQPYTALPFTHGYNLSTGGSNTTCSPNKSGLYLHVDSATGSVIAAIYFARLQSNTNEWFQLLITK